jgi:O-antigen ligase
MIKNKINLFYIFFGFVFLLAPFFYVPNIGGAGLRLPFNIMVWFVVPWFICIGIFLMLKSKSINLPKVWCYFIPFIAIVILTGTLNNSEPVAWLFRQGTIFGGILFLLALFQIGLTQKYVELALYLLLLAIFLHACIVLLQTQFPDYLPSWLPPSLRGKPYGMFQQVNIQASYMATALVIVGYLISRPSFQFSRLPLKLFLIIVVAVCSYVNFATGSRIGLLAMLLSLSILVITRYKYLAKHKGYIAILLVMIGGIAWLAQDGINQSLEKTATLTEGENKAARLSMYQIGTELVLQKPFVGHGIGNFKQVWAQQSGGFQQRFPNAAIPEEKFTTHPHNEILFWLIEGGSFVVFGMAIMILGIGIALYRCGFSRGGSYLAMLLPITLHTQVEMPFYGSSVHWFTWIFLLFLPLRHRTITYGVNLSRYAILSIYISFVSLSLLVSSFMLHTLRSQSDIFNFLYTKSEPPYLQIAMNNLYFKPLAVELAMRSKLYNGIDTGNEQYVRSFIFWASDKTPAISLLIYEDLVKAYDHLNYINLDCSVLAKGKDTYPNNKELIDGYTECISNR